MEETPTKPTQTAQPEAKAPPPPVAIIWFCYDLDQDLLPESVKAAKKIFGDKASYHAVDDGFSPMDEVHRRWCVENGMTYRQTFYARGSHLVGPDNLEGHVETLLRVAAESGAQVVVKHDCDSVILRTDWVLDLLKPGCRAVMSASYKTKLNYPMGFAYAIKSAVLPALLKDIRLYWGWPGCFEDYEIGTRLMRLCGDDPGFSLRYKSLRTVDGFPICEPWQITKTHLQARAVSVGWNATPHPEATIKAYKQKQVAILKQLNAWREEAEKVSS